MLEILSLIIQFFKNNLETIITLCSLLFVAIQTRTLSRTYKYNCSWQEKEKAAELAYMYKENILPNVNYISAVQKDTGIMELLGNINLDSIATFNQTYYYIAIQNKNEKDKFYTNVIELFEKWRTNDKENEKKISNAISRPLPIKK